MKEVSDSKVQKHNSLFPALIIPCESPHREGLIILFPVKLLNKTKMGKINVTQASIADYPLNLELLSKPGATVSEAEEDQHQFGQKYWG